MSVGDGVLSPSYWRNQKVETTCTYVYDALYQLIGAAGREMGDRGQQGHTLPAAKGIDENRQVTTMEDVRLRDVRVRFPLSDEDMFNIYREG